MLMLPAVQSMWSTIVQTIHNNTEHLILSPAVYQEVNDKDIDCLPYYCDNDIEYRHAICMDIVMLKLAFKYNNCYR